MGALNDCPDALYAVCSDLFVDVFSAFMVDDVVVIPLIQVVISHKFIGIDD